MPTYMKTLEVRPLKVRDSLYYRIAYKVDGRNYYWNAVYKTLPGTRLYRDFHEAWNIMDFAARSYFYQYCQSHTDLKALYWQGVRVGMTFRKDVIADGRNHLFSNDWLLDSEVNWRFMYVSLPTKDHYRARRQGIWDGFKQREY